MLGVSRCRVWDMRLQKIVKTMDTSKEGTSIEIIQQGQHITTADGNEVTAHACIPSSSAFALFMASTSQMMICSMPGFKC